MVDNIQKTFKSKASAHGAGEWVEERVLALFSIPLLLWLIANLIWIYSCGCYESFEGFVKMPLNTVFLIMFLGFFLKYTFLGMKVVFEDYVSCECAKWTLILGMKFVGIFAFLTGTLSVLKIFFS